MDPEKAQGLYIQSSVSVCLYVFVYVCMYVCCVWEVLGSDQIGFPNAPCRLTRAVAQGKQRDARFEMASCPLFKGVRCVHCYYDDLRTRLPI